jgi:hypothetical protein
MTAHSNEDGPPSSEKYGRRPDFEISGVPEASLVAPALQERGSRLPEGAPVSPIHPLRLAVLASLAAGALAAWPASADAQRARPVRRPVVRSVVVVGGFGYPRYRFYRPYYSPWFRYGSPWWWGPYPLYDWGYGFRDVLTSSVRLEVTPREAEVYVDGYAAGRVDDFDGIFQRLRLRPGAHEIVIYLDGYRTVRQNLYLNPGSDQKVRYALERLPAGETSEPPPPPRAAPEGADSAPPRRFPFEAEPEPARQPESEARFGTLVIRVQPADADIVIDGDRWVAAANDDRMTIRLPEGRHRIEIRKEGFAQYREDVLVRRDRTMTLNVSLSRGDISPR